MAMLPSREVFVLVEISEGKVYGVSIYRNKKDALYVKNCIYGEVGGGSAVDIHECNIIEHLED